MAQYTARELLDIKRGDVITFDQGAHRREAEVIAVSQDALRKPGIGRIVITARRKMRALTRAQEELPVMGPRGVCIVRGDKVLSIAKKAK